MCLEFYFATQGMSRAEINKRTSLATRIRVVLFLERTRRKQKYDLIRDNI